MRKVRPAISSRHVSGNAKAGGLEFFFKLVVEEYTLRWSMWYFRKKIGAR